MTPSSLLKLSNATSKKVWRPEQPLSKRWMKSRGPSLAALLLRPKSERRGPLQKFFNWFNRVFGRATNQYVRWSGTLIRKSAIALVVLLAFGAAAAFFANKVPTSFLPDEDQGYLFLHLQLPSAASIERTEDAARKVEKILAGT